jgi:hypothetical protein
MTAPSNPYLPSSQLSCLYRTILRFCFLCVTLFTAQLIHAQVGISLKTDHSSYLRYEPIRLDVTIHNVAGNNLRFGPKHGGIKIRIESRGRVSKEIDEVFFRLPQPTTIPSGTARQFSFQLNNSFNLTAERTYTCMAVLKHPRLASDYTGEEHSFKVHEPLTVWKRSVGIPVESEKETIPQRTFAVLLFEHKRIKTFCVMLRDEKFVYTVERICKKLEGVKPQCAIDANSNLHLLIRMRSSLYVYHVYNWRGELMQKKLYNIAETKPRLLTDSELGTVMVVGGEAATEGLDYVRKPESQL